MSTRPPDVDRESHPCGEPTVGQLVAPGSDESESHSDRGWTLARPVAAVAMVAAVAVALAMAAPPTSASSVDLITYVTPVDGPVVDGFRPPEHVGAPGNRGLQYGNRPFVPVVASADGRVQFAGLVFGSGTMTIAHADGVTTTYNGLGEIWVDVGYDLAQGQALGLAGTTVHFGARLGQHYIDPQILIDASNGGAPRLVPVVGGGAAGDL